MIKRKWVKQSDQLKNGITTRRRIDIVKNQIITHVVNQMEVQRAILDASHEYLFRHQACTAFLWAENIFAEQLSVLTTQVLNLD